MEFYYEQNSQTGKWEKVSGDQMKTDGRFIFKEGNWIRLGYARCVPDLPYSRKTFDCGAGVVNPVDGKMYYERNKYEDSVKRAGCRVVGEEASVSTKPKEIVGDFNVREELTKVTRQVLSKQ